jgi:cell division cycle 20-like protein 1 (cofactor of APC complex)
VTKLLDLTSSTDPIASVSWTQRGQYLAVGTAKGSVQLWDATACRMVRSLSGHRHRVCSLAWHGHNMCSGSRDRTILVRDVRTSANEAIVAKLTCHRSEVCGLRWSPDGRELASGGNDNMVCIWSARHMFGSTAAREAQDTPMLRFEAHTAAIKALAWSPHTSNLLATGGGTADRCIRFWSTATGGCLGCVDTGSQVCNLAWSANVDELVSTHGYSQNQVILWRHGGPTGVPGSPSGGTVATAAGTTTGGQNAGTGAAGGAMMPPGMQRLSKMATLVGHSMRVLYLAVSPDGQTIVTGAGDETLRFWNLFPGAPNCHFRQPVSPLCLGRSSIR